MKELDGFDFGVKPTKELHPKRFESVLHPFPRLIGCCILHEAHLDCFDEGHPYSSPKRWLSGEYSTFTSYGHK